MNIMMLVSLVNELDFVQGFQKYMKHGCYVEEYSSRTSLNIDDLFDHPDIPDGNHDGCFGHQ